MSEMADAAVRRYHNRLQAIVQALALAVLLLLGVLGFWISVGMFLPLIQLIRHA
jgi:type II secretory pathway component PulF